MPNSNPVSINPVEAEYVVGTITESGKSFDMVTESSIHISGDIVIGKNTKILREGSKDDLLQQSHEYHYTELRSDINKLQQQIKEEPQMFTVFNVIIIMIICIVTVKWIIPRLTIRYTIRKFVNWVWKPGKKQIKIIETEWDEATKK